MKFDAKAIKVFLSDLAERDWIKRTERRWWPRFVFHYTDVNNAVSILNDNYIYSRQYTEEQGKLITSSGSKAVLASTDSDVKNCVRLYFRPLTPTQFNVEGSRPKHILANSRYPDAHCPVPVFFLFDSSAILTREDCWFSDGGLGSGKARKYLTSAKELESLPWKKIYHHGSISTSERDIIFHRNAEILVHEKLDLNNLRYIYCRSEAEKETLMYLLPPNLLRKYQNKIVATSRSNLYFRKHTFIQTVRLAPNRIDFNFSPDTQSPGPFHVKVVININDIPNILKRKFPALNTTLPISFKRHLNEYTVQVELDNNLVYSNQFKEIDIPF